MLQLGLAAFLFLHFQSLQYACLEAIMAFFFSVPMSWGSTSKVTNDRAGKHRAPLRAQARP